VKTEMVELMVRLVVCGALVVATSGCARLCRCKAGQYDGKGVKTGFFGKTKDGRRVYLYTLTNANGLTATITNYGAIVTSLRVPDRNGKFADIVLGFDSLAPYLERHPYFGAIVGRYGNRIARGKFTLDGIEYTLATNNNGIHHLHGGNVGFDKVLWDARVLGDGRAAVKFSYSSKDMEEGYPGNLRAHVTYELTDDDELSITYEAETDKATPVNLTHHGYFNLTGVSDNVLGHVITINANRYTVVDDELIPTGELARVRGTPFDFRTPETIGARIDQVPGGYDHNFVLNRKGKGLERVVRVYEPKSGRVMEVLTTEPGVQFYSGNFLDGTIVGKGGRKYYKHAGFCLETQHFPDSPNHPEFPNTILRPGEKYFQHTVYKFSVE